MTRPADSEWAVLDESEDPVPGDPHEIRTESSRLGKMAATIRDQIALLQDIAGDDNIGKFADTLRETATDLRDGLDKVATRYEHVSEYLGHWADDLDQCQSDSLRALARAQAVATTANAPELKPAPGSPQPQLTPEQQQRQAAAERARQAAQDELAGAKAQLARTKSHRDDRAGFWKQRIEDTEHDGLKDSRWDSFKDFIHQHAELIKLLADVCTWIVTALVIVSLFIPVLDIATALLGGLMLAALLGHTAVALTGDGSWIDVGLDVFALATLGASSWSEALLKGSTGFADGVARGLRGSEEVGTAAAKTAADGADLLGKTGQSPGVRFSSFMADYGRAVAEKFLAGGEKEVGEHMATLRSLAEEFPDTRLFPNALARGTSFLNTVRLANGAANIVDEAGHWAGGSDLINWVGNGFAGGLAHPELEGDTSPHWDTFGRLKELTTHEVGS
ncbi:hypothetical protein GA0115240_16315 [Streptomyces sp. DvalAA-14]|uniref:hypothetical protein n=1 Tax=unclassified Streptomyces TaxID=2593676 RepID=UPI00081B6F9B|nr:MULTISPECIES: hypothetical protein [unclassified Streptomyces]MYS24292.1 hypothetical protein [Streptomyces sp. SID4948]SCE44701.1 hypothetical protein GA0115240_16315 [Streptomyces sp. DvalAA-14]